MQYTTNYSLKKPETTDYVNISDLNYNADLLDGLISALNPLYAGVDLTTKYATEIASYSDEWAWIKARITAGNFTGIYVKDYIPVTTVTGTTYKARILGINTYKGYGDTAVGNHIDWMFEELWEEKHRFNIANYNNGISSQESPWLASDIYHWANSLSGSVPGTNTVNPTLVSVDYTEGGIYYCLPQTLKDVIIEKRMRISTRYSSSGILTTSNNSVWANIGKIWFPTECEVYGSPVFSTGSHETRGSALQYPYFVCNMNRVKLFSGYRQGWFLLSSFTGSAAVCCIVSNYGDAGNDVASASYYCSAVCFRT